MGRKFKLSVHRKNEERRKYAVTSLPVSIQLESSVNFMYMHNFDIPGTGISSFIMIIRYLSTPEKLERYRRLHSQQEATTKRLHRLQRKLEDILEKQGVTVHEDLHGDLESITQEHSPDIASI